MKRIVITGAAGFVGSAVIKELLEHNVEIWAIVRPGFMARMEKSRLKGLPIQVIECDMSNISAMSEKIKERDFDAWYHFAWEGLRGDALVDYHTQIRNIDYLLDSVCAAARIGCKKFIGSGSISQYELQLEQGQPMEGDKHRVYKTAKLACEYMGKSVAAENGIEFIWPIITNIYGVGETSPRLINSMIRNLQAGKHQSLSEGNQFYDFIYIKDAAKAFRLIGEQGRAGRRYILASGQVQPLKNFLNTVRDVVAPGTQLEFGEMKFNGIYMPEEYYSIDELVEDTGFKPDVEFAEGIRMTAEWIRNTEK